MSTAAHSPTHIPSRKSFAQVAAAAHKPAVPQVKAPASTETTSPKPREAVDERTAEGDTKDDFLVQDVPVVATSQPPPADDASRLHVMMKSATLDDQNSSSLEYMGRKENSDTKSVASRTTFTLDEKESLRPDDSASMQAGGDDDSPSESVIAGAKVNAASDARAFRDQLYEIDRTETSGMIAQRQAGSAGLASQRSGGVLFSASNGAPPPPLEPPQHPPSTGPPPGLVIPPDEKLQEALASPKDRLFVLKVEQDLIDFIKDSKENELQLPQTNAFYRMLCHKLAEYYFLGHVVDDSMSAVRIFRLPHSKLPPPLIKSETKPDGATPPPPSSARKIMRRGAGDLALLGNDGEGKPDAENASGSDEDKDGPSKPRDKSSLTREEREKQYAEVRARIFEDFTEGKHESEGGTGHDSKEISRASSASGHRKKAKKRPKDDSFEARSAYSQFNGQSYVNQGYFQAQGNPPYFPTMTGHPGYPGSPQQFAQPQHAYNMGAQMGQQDYASCGPWTDQQYGGSYDNHQGMGGMPQYSPAHYDPSSGGFQPYSVSNMPNMHSQATPKPQQSSLAGFYQAYQHHQAPNGMPWPQQDLRSGYTPPNMYPEGGQFMMPYNNARGGYTQQDFQQHQGYPGQPFAMYQGGQFNPASQAFIPRANSGQWHHMQPHMQPQASNSAFTSPRFSHTSPNVSAARSNQTHSQNSRKSSQTSGNMDSITKWATPANLPAKPPPSSSTLNFQTPKFTENPQPLPNHPFAAASNNSKQ